MRSAEQPVFVGRVCLYVEQGGIEKDSRKEETIQLYARRDKELALELLN